MVYQKKYLLLLLGGFRENETKTLATIAKMGAYPSFHEPKTRFSPAFTKFRTAVRVVVAAKRMKFLVCKSKKSVQLVMEPVSPSRTIPKKSEYNQGTPYIGDSSRFGINGSHRENGSTETGFLTEICNGNVQVFSPKQTEPGYYSTLNHRPVDMASSRALPYTGFTDRLDTRSVQRYA